MSDTNTYSLLYVNDNDGMREDDTEWFQQHHFEITHARNTNDAFSLFKDGHYDVVVTDLRRRENDGMNARAGIELLERIKTTDHEAPVVIYSFNVPEAVAQEAVNHGVALVTENVNQLRNYILSDIVKP